MQPFQIASHAALAAQAHSLINADLSIYDSVAGLARKLGTNSFTLKAAFRQRYEESVFSYSRRTRMEAARRLLLETDYTIQTIAELVGYTEGNNFQASFKQVMGKTPGEVRRDKL